MVHYNTVDKGIVESLLKQMGLRPSAKCRPIYMYHSCTKYSTSKYQVPVLGMQVQVEYQY